MRTPRSVARPARSAAVFVVVVQLITSVGPANGQQHLACSRGDLAICEAIIRMPRLAPGIRAAVEQLLTEVRDGMAACDRGEVEACTELLARYPDFPAPVRAALEEALTRPKSQ